MLPEIPLALEWLGLLFTVMLPTATVVVSRWRARRSNRRRRLAQSLVIEQDKLIRERESLQEGIRRLGARHDYLEVLSRRLDEYGERVEDRERELARKEDELRAYFAPFVGSLDRLASLRRDLNLQEGAYQRLPLEMAALLALPPPDQDLMLLLVSLYAVTADESSGESVPYCFSEALYRAHLALARRGMVSPLDFGELISSAIVLEAECSSDPRQLVSSYLVSSQKLPIAPRMLLQPGAGEANEE